MIMAKRQHQDSIQEKAVAGGTQKSAMNNEAQAAMKQTGGHLTRIPCAQMMTGDFIVLDTRRNRPDQATSAAKITKLVWSRQRERCVINDRYVYSYGGFVEILDFSEETARKVAQHVQLVTAMNNVHAANAKTARIMAMAAKEAER
jgi:hypothetical protein